MNRDTAREYFKSKGLSYDDVFEEEFTKLKEFVLEELTGFDSKLNMKLSKDFKKYEPDIDRKGIIRGFLYVDGAYFKRREAISFNSDRFIGFAGWSDSFHVMPFINAFVRWCNWLSIYKGK